jgi:hypothetical protein
MKGGHKVRTRIAKKQTNPFVCLRLKCSLLR